jgi:molecular chaperone GrpE
MQNQEHNVNDESPDQENGQNETDIKAENSEKTDGSATPEKNAAGDEDKIKELNDKYLRLYSEFDNYRKRTMKERSDLIKTAAEEVFKAILPVIDDLDRAVKANEKVEDAGVIKEGMMHISNKLRNVTQQKGLTSFQSIGEAFDPDTMEAITHIPASNDNEKGKVIDEVEKGYKLGDKVIRFAKVVIAQ